MAAALAPAASAYTPERGAVEHEGQSGRYLLDRSWLVRHDARDVGLRRHWQRSVSRSGWRATQVPGEWNAGRQDQEAMIGHPVWYRNEFSAPHARAGSAWIVRFEAANYRATVWLNGRKVGSHTGGYLPFELPLKDLRTSGENRLVVRVDNRTLPTDLPPSQYTYETGARRGGFWNSGGLIRPVYLRSVDDVDLENVQVQPRLPCPTCAATIAFRATVRNYSERALRVSLTGSYGEARVRFGELRLEPGRARVVRASVDLPQPRLWSPTDPALYDAEVTASVAESGGDSKEVQTYSLRSGVRSITRAGDGHLLLNGRPISFRGVGLPEDSPANGGALSTADQDARLATVGEVGATMIRMHYPLARYTLEQADRLGILVWDELPVYQVRGDTLGLRSVRRAGLSMLHQNIAANINHPSILTWSIANELTDRPGPAEKAWYTAAAAAAHGDDPTRPVSIAIAGHPSAGCQAAYGPIDLIGINDYFGFKGSVSDQNTLSPYLDQVHACYPGKAIAVSEFGAPGDHDGPANEPRTYANQQQFVRFHTGVYASKPWLSGAIYWVLPEYRVRPNWVPGTALYPNSLLDWAGNRKPAFFELQQSYQGTAQYP